MKRRKFIRHIFVVSSGIAGASTIPFLHPWNVFTNLSQIVISRNQTLNKPDSDQIARLLDNGLQAMFNTDSPVSALQKVFNSGERIGIKVNCLSGRGSTNSDLVNLLIERLRESGIPAQNIIVWDRFSSDLEDGGFRIRTAAHGVRFMGNDSLGFEENFEEFGSAASLICKTLTRACDAVINVPLLKDHGIAGITCCLKNFFGAIHNPNKYHLNTGDPYIADVYRLPSISGKVRLHICDALVAQYEGGPSFMPQWRWPFNGLLIGTDPVALDQTAWDIIETKRKENGLPSLKEIGREPTYIRTAADKAHRLGTNRGEQIRILNV